MRKKGFAEIKAAQRSRHPGAELIRLADVAELLSCGLRTVQRMLADGRLPVQPIRYNRKMVRWHKAEILAWIAAQRGDD